MRFGDGMTLVLSHSKAVTELFSCGLVSPPPRLLAKLSLQGDVTGLPVFRIQGLLSIFVPGC